MVNLSNRHKDSQLQLSSAFLKHFKKSLNLLNIQIHKKIYTSALIVVAFALVLTACAKTSNQEETSIRGFIRDFSASTLQSFDTVTVEDEKGILWHFSSNGRVFPGFSPSHLRDHMITGKTILITYEKGERSMLLVHGISD